MTVKKPAKKGRAIVETDTDGGYVMSEKNIEESAHVKKFDRFIVDIKTNLEARKRSRSVGILSREMLLLEVKLTTPKPVNST